MDKLDNTYLRSMGARIKKYRKLKGLTQGELASAAGFKDHSAISQIEKGMNDISRERFVKIADTLGVDIAVLLFDQNEQPHDVIIECFSVPVMADITPTASEAVGSVEIPKSSEGDFFGFNMIDDSMEPFVISGDLLIVKKQPFAVPDDIVVVSVNGEPAIVRRFQREKKTIFLIADNQKYRPQIFPPDGSDSLTMFGVVTELRRKI